MTASSFAVTDQCHAHLFRRGDYVVPKIRRRGYTKVTTDSFDSQTLLQQPRKAPPMGRALRILLGLVLIVYTVPVYFQVPMRLAVGAWLLVLGLIGVYSLIHIVVSRRIVAFGPFLGMIVATALLVGLYVAGASGLPILGHGKGQLAAVTFLGVSLVVAGVRAAPGLRTDGDPRRPVWKAHRTGVSYLLPSRPA